jgi:hypothetical protein
MATLDPAPIPFPLQSFPGANPQESAGRLINCFAEPLGDADNPTGPAKVVYRRCAGLSVHAMTAQANYRGGLIVKNLSYETWTNDAKTIDVNGAIIDLGNLPGTKKVSIARNNATNPDVVAVDLDNGAFILNTTAIANAQVVATIAGGAFNAADTVALLFQNLSVQGFPVLVTYTLGGGESATTIATGLKNLINANATLAAANVAATNVAGVLTITQQGAIGNQTTVSATITGTGSETVTFNPVSGQMTGGAGTPGIVFAGAPLAYTGVGAMPQPNSVCFQDGYLFFTVATGQVFATAINSLSMNSLTSIVVQGRQDVTLLRGIAFEGLLLLFTTGSLEIFQDAAIPAPAFPYSRFLVKDTGLIQATAIAGWETGFAELIWVAQDFGVYWLTPGSTAPLKISTPDVERQIEAQIRAGNTLEAGIHVVAGRKFWTLSSPAWTWQFNVTTKRWSERQSLSVAGIYGRWRGTLGHPAFNRWLVGDQLTGNLLWVDSGNATENGSPLMFWIESGPNRNFPGQIRIARADFDFDMGVGQAVGNVQTLVTGAAASPSGAIRLAVFNSAQMATNDQANVSGVTGTTEANGTWPIAVVDATHVDLIGSVFVHAYVSGGTLIDVTSPPNAINPSCAIYCSKDGGNNWGNPLIRYIGQQAKSKRSRASVKNMGQSGPMGDRWRIVITDPIPTVGFFGGTQSSNPKEVGA